MHSRRPPRLDPTERRRRQGAGSALLQPREVARIKRLLNEGMTISAIARDLGMSYEAIAKIRRGHSWHWVAAEVLGPDGQPLPTHDEGGEPYAPPTPEQRAAWAAALKLPPPKRSQITDPMTLQLLAEGWLYNETTGELSPPPDIAALNERIAAAEPPSPHTPDGSDRSKRYLGD